jgi:4-amino-4-deoxy-L-arabinose transferase-like glycosyltransferase
MRLFDKYLRYYWVESALILPILLLFLKINDVIPRTPYLHYHREIANAFRSLAIAYWGFGSFNAALPGESFAGVGLYQSLCAILVKIGYMSGGRLVSIIFTIFAAIILYEIVRNWESRIIAFLTVLIFFSNPMLWDFAVAIKPEALSIFFVLLCLWQGVLYDKTKSNKYLIFCLLAVFFGVVNHGWEASVLLPLALIFSSNAKDRKIYFLLIAIALIAISANKLYTCVAGIPPLLKASFSSYSVFYHYHYLFKPGFWISRAQPVDLMQLQSVGDIYLSGLLIISLCASPLLFFRPRKSYDRILAMWLFSGATIPLVFPKGWAVHAHYGWAMITPVSIVLAVGFYRLISKFTKPSNLRVIFSCTGIFLVLIASVGISIDNKRISGTIEAQREGIELKSELRARNFNMADVGIVIMPGVDTFSVPQYTLLLYSELIVLGYNPVSEPVNSLFSPGIYRSLAEAMSSNRKAIIILRNNGPPFVDKVVWRTS